jgi:hypothetical protein|tara:strand:- start:1241 stop:1612 length:372 start_codon:yes stop_codon:yes gene_type:complete
MSSQKEITGKAVKRILLQEEFLINGMPIATFERDEFGSIVRGINIKTNQPDHLYLELPALEDIILSFLRGHYKNQRNDLSNKKKKNVSTKKIKPQERRAKEAERFKEERHKNKHHSKKVRKKS